MYESPSQVLSFMICMQKLKTSVKKRSVNPIWHEELTLTVTNPSQPLKLVSEQQIDLFVAMHAF